MHNFSQNIVASTKALVFIFFGDFFFLLLFALEQCQKVKYDLVSHKITYGLDKIIDTCMAIEINLFLSITSLQEFEEYFAVLRSLYRCSMGIRSGLLASSFRGLRCLDLNNFQVQFSMFWVIVLMEDPLPLMETQLSDTRPYIML